MSKEIAVFSNRRSRQNRLRPELLSGLKEAYGEQADFFEPEDMVALRSNARTVLERGYRFVAINGGDGTNHQVLTAFGEVSEERPLPRICLLRGGTMNNVTDSLGIRGTPMSILGALCEAVAAGSEQKVTRRAMLRVADGEVERLGFIFGTGLMANFLKAYYAEGATSPWTAAWMAAKVCASVALQGPLFEKLSDKEHHTIEVDGEHWIDKDLFCLMCATTEQVGLGLSPFTSAGRQTDRFCALALEGPLLSIVTALPAIWRAAPMTMRGFEERLPQRLDLHLPRKFDYTIDGDLYVAERISLSMGPVLELVIP
jgi:diacylglycerol kinase family enzyme